MKQDKLYVCIKSQKSGNLLDILLSKNQIIQDFIDIFEDYFESVITSIKVNRSFDMEFDIKNFSKTFGETDIANGDILIINC